MNSTNGTVENITPGALRELMASQPESAFQLIDVRQPEEYRDQHIPGATLVPLLDVEQDPGRIEARRFNVFYCRSGARSMRAATHVVRVTGMQHVYNLEGGVLGWGGRRLPDMPNIRAFPVEGPLTDVLMRALDLEKGAHRLYDHFLDRFAGTTIEKEILPLTQAEEGHGRTIHAMLRRVAAEPPPPFEALFEGLPGELLEGGESLEALAGRVEAVAEEGISALLELALDLELKAYDLYRNLAARADDPQTRDALLDLSAQERRHAEQVVRSMARHNVQSEQARLSA